MTITKEYIDAVNLRRYEATFELHIGCDGNFHYSSYRHNVYEVPKEILVGHIIPTHAIAQMRHMAKNYFLSKINEAFK